MSKVFQRIQEFSENEDSVNLERSLKWLLFLPQGCLRQARRGGAAGRQIIAKRFNKLIEDDWGQLVELFLRDREVCQQKRERKRNVHLNDESQNKKNLERKANLAVSLISKGYISKAQNRMTSHGVANLEDPKSKEALKKKYPSRSREIPESVAKGEAVVSMKNMRNIFLSLKGGVAAGSGGLRPEYLVTVAEHFEEDDPFWDFLEYFCLSYVNAKLPPWFYKSVMTVQTVGLYKTASMEADKVRPIGMRNPFIKSIHREVIRQNKSVIQEYLEPQQLGTSVAGAAKLVHSVRMMMEENPDFVLIKIDFRNAFNEMARARVIEACEENESLKHLAMFVGAILAPVSDLESAGVIWGEAEEGVTQGDPTSSPLFCIALQKYLVEGDRKLSEHGGMVRAGMDDAYILGPPHVSFPVLENLKKDCKIHCGLELQMTKTEIYTKSGEQPPDTPVGLIRAGQDLNGTFESGFVCYGIPVGTDNYVDFMLNCKLDEIQNDIKIIQETLSENRQAMWAVLRSSISQKLDYWLTLVYPSQIQKVASKMDKVLKSVLNDLIGIEVPEKENGYSWSCPINIPVEGQSGKSFQSWIVRQPIRMGGLGIRSQVEVSPAAFIGGVEMSLPHFTNGDTVCQQLEPVIGNFNGNVKERWSRMIESGCRTGKEFTTAWEKLQKEAEEYAQFLGQDLPPGPLQSPTSGAGDGSEDGSTRRAVVRQIEELRGAVLKESMKRNRNVNSKQVLAIINRDKLSSSWLQCLPGPNGINNAGFSEAMALTLCMPSPVCQERVGEKIGRKVVDIYGDNVMSEQLPGDHWRTRHDQVKMTVNSILSWSRVSSTCEVFGLFGHLIPKEGLSRMESGRARQGLVPDFKIALPDKVEGTKEVLAEIKVINCCPSRYTPSGPNVKAVNKRAQLLPGEYRKKARDIDQKIIKTPAEVRGPVERRLGEYGNLKDHVCIWSFWSSF